MMTSDEYPAYATAIGEVFGEPVPAPPQRRTGRPCVVSERRLAAAEMYAPVAEHRGGGRGITGVQRQVFGYPEGPGEARGGAAASRRVNTSFVERQNGTDRGRNARKAHRFSKDWQVHEAMTYLTLYSYNFCSCVRTLRVKDEHGRWRGRSPALAAGLTD